SEASDNTPPTSQSQNQEIFLGEEEIFDVSLSTFYVFDKENTRRPPPAQQLRFARCGGCGGCGGHGGGCGCGGPGGGRGHCGVGGRGPGRRRGHGGVWGSGPSGRGVPAWRPMRRLPRRLPMRRPFL